jgi:hypothetical protein
MAVNLQHFSGKDLRLDQEQTRRTLKFFFPQTDIDHINVTDDDRSFAQALLVEAIDASSKMSYVKVIFDKLYTPPIGFDYIKDLAKQLVKCAMVNWFQHATGEDFRNPKLYIMAVDQLRLNFRSVWTIRLQTDELTY